MKVLYCEQCGEVITEDSFGLELNGLYFCSDTCLHDYVDMTAGLIPEGHFELYGEEPEEGDEEETD
jgi:hypothetical protein